MMFAETNWEPQAKQYSNMNLKDQITRERTQSKGSIEAGKDSSQYAAEQEKKLKLAKKKAEKRKKQKEREKKGKESKPIAPTHEESDE
jgi:uncharacterized protein YaiL (DUF2058 family)